MTVIYIGRKKTKQIPQQPNYSVTKDGEVYRISTKKKMKVVPHGRSGYLAFRSCHNNRPSNTFVHVCVAQAWLHNDAPEIKTQVNHKDGNKINNLADNLEWVTPSQNQRHAIETGLKSKGSDLYNSQLTDDQVHLICQRLEDGALVKDLSSQFGVSKDIIRKVRAGDTYFHIRTLYDLSHEYKYDFSESTIRWICNKIVKGWSDRHISKESTNSNLSTIEVKRVRNKIRYKHISDEYF